MPDFEALNRMLDDAGVVDNRVRKLIEFMGASNSGRSIIIITTTIIIIIIIIIINTQWELLHAIVIY